MNFDLFIKYKNHIPEKFRQYINRAKLFAFDMYPTETLEGIDLEEIQDLVFNFCLPFPVVAVEDKTSCVILWDTIKNSVGIEFRRGMMEIVDTKNYTNEKSFKASSQDLENGFTDEQHRESCEEMEKIFGKGNFPMVFRCGYSQLNWDEGLKKWSGRSELEECKYILSDGKEMDLLRSSFYDRKLKDGMDQDFGRGTITAYEELIRMSAIKSFILEKKPIKKNKKNKYLYSYEKPIYTTVSPKHARSIMGIKKSKEESEKQIKERRAHIRREHERHLTSPKFTRKQGQTIKVKRTYVPSIWSGDSENIVGKHHYKVLLDMPKNIRDSCK
jgi:hypothetical protein